MALGFGFNKAKVLASAEKYVQQGKLQNAISDYEKVVKEDPKDLTVLNTIGDLNSRIGKNDEAAHYFKKVGEAYAANGFTVKAIAMYKKLTKLTPHALDCLQRLAELYTVQGLYNDARSQYVQVADSYLKSGNNDDAAKIFQKILELDPDNTAMQTRLADLYIKLGKKTEARNIYFTAAQSLYLKQAMDAADEALGNVLNIDPKNVDALLLRGTIAAESGDGNNAIQYLKDIPDIDSRPEALRSMLRAHLLLKNPDEAKLLAVKLINVHNDLNGITWYAESLLNAGQFVEALAIYEEFADKVLASKGPALLKSLNAVISRVKDSPAALESLRNLFTKAGDNTHDAEIKELLAHTYVHEGQLEKARDLYHELAESEPENPLHQQNYKQVIAKLGEDSAARPLTAEQGAQAFMMEESDHKAPTIHQTYPNDIAIAVQSALTDSELFDSYNLPVKAIPPLEAGLAQAPRDFQINLRLATLYSKVSRFADAAQACNVVKELYAENNHPQESQKYADLATRYLEKAEQQGQSAPVDAAVPEVADFGFSVEVPIEETSSVNLLNLTQAEPAPAAMEIPVAPAFAEPAAPVASESHELDIDQWESMLSVDGPPPAAVPEVAPISMEVEASPIEMIVEPAQEAASTFDLTPASADGASVSDFSFEVPSPAAPEPPAPIAAAAPTPIKVTLEPPPPPAPAPAVQDPPPIAAAPVAAAKAAPAPSDDLDLLGDLVSDLEDSLGDAFDFGGKPSAPPAAPASASIPAPMAAAAAAVAIPAAAPTPVAPESVPMGFSSMGHEIPTAAPEIEQHEATSALSDMFSEFKEDVEETAGQAEDPDTHYNLGIAFKEMGLLDEAIGELQKVCHAIEHGHPFDQGIQAYTWLAQCLVDKGVPQAAVRWYEKALQVKGMNEDSRLAVYYDLACAHEAAGNPKKAYETFMEVYSSNIDYRDVADRIKSLKV